MKAIRFRFLVAALSVLLATAVANSQTTDTAPTPVHEHAYGMGGGHMMHFWAKQLDLTDAQKAQMRDIMEKERPTMKPLMQQARQTRQQLRHYEQGTYDEAKVRALAAQQAQTMAELTVQKTRIHSEMYQLLTPDQQAKLKEFEAKHQARMHRHMSEGAAPPEE
jgi:Spy/CpxP family protein refolding chaperone